jgi:hypothetical protein
MNNYVKIQFLHDGSGLTAKNIEDLTVITLFFGLAVFARAYYFAVANVKETQRISQQLDLNVIMN